MVDKICLRFSRFLSLLHYQLTSLIRVKYNCNQSFFFLEDLVEIILGKGITNIKTLKELAVLRDQICDVIVAKRDIQKLNFWEKVKNKFKKSVFVTESRNTKADDRVVWQEIKNCVVRNVHVKPKI